MVAAPNHVRGRSQFARRPGNGDTIGPGKNRSDYRLGAGYFWRHWCALRGCGRIQPKPPPTPIGALNPSISNASLHYSITRFRMNPRRWLHEHSLKLLAIRDTPEAIAGGVAIGIFFGFSALFGLKTLLTILFAWLTRSNILAAVLASASHDILLPLMPVIYRFEYD